MDLNQLRQYIRDFTLDGIQGESGYKRVLLQLFGLGGHGKSAFINSCKFALDGEYQEIAETGERGNGLTMERRSYKLTDTITIVDNRGFSTGNDAEALEVYTQMGNFHPLDEKVEWTEQYEAFIEKLHKLDPNPNYTDITVPVFVTSSRWKIPRPQEPELETLFNTCLDMTGIFPIIVLTYKNQASDLKGQRETFTRLGAEQVLAVENYTREDTHEIPGSHRDILNVIWTAVSDVKFFLKQKRDQKKERIDRRIRLQKLSHRLDAANHCNK